MPETGRYEKIPRPESLSFFVERMESHSMVVHVHKINDVTYTIVRNKGKKPLTIFLTNIYVVSLVDVTEILSDVENIDAIVTVSPYNGYSTEAESYAKSQNVGLFTFREFMGAINYSGSKFLDYELPD